MKQKTSNSERSWWDPMTKIKKSELAQLLKTVESSNEEMYNQLYSLNHRISAFSTEPALSGDGWDSAKNKFQTGYPVVTTALYDILGVVEQELNTYINSFSVEVDTPKDELDMNDLQNLYFEAQRLTAEHNKILTQLAEIPVVGKLFDEFNLTKVMDDIEVLQDFQQFVSAHGNDFDYIDELLTNLENGLNELGSETSFLGAETGFAMVDYSKTSWSKEIKAFQKNHQTEITAGQTQFKQRIQARTIGTVIGLQSMGTNMDIMNLKGPWENAARDFYMPDYQNKMVLLNREMKISDLNKNMPEDDRFLNSPILFNLNDLKDTTNFQNDNTLVHIFQGNLNRRGSAGGYHSEFIPDTPGSVIPGTKTPPSISGIYEGQVTVNGISKAGNQRTSSFFPEHWEPQFVVNTINEAYMNRSFIQGTRNTYRGIGSDIVIETYISPSGKIISAFPVY